MSGYNSQQTLSQQQAQPQQTNIDLRLMQLAIDVNGQLKTFDQQFNIRAKGEKFASPQQNTCDVEIYNLTREDRNYILTQTSPFNTSPTINKTIYLYAGRQSTGLFLVYQGNIAVSKITQPPDLALQLKCGTIHSKKGKVGFRIGGKVTSVSTIAQGIASNLELKLQNELGTSAKNVGNYNYAGNAHDEIAHLKDVAGCDCYCDDDKLILKPTGTPLSGTVLNLSETTGMIGVPEVTEKGLKVTFLFDNAARLGGGLNVTSVLNPAATGQYTIYKLRFRLSSREKDFYYEAECTRNT